MPSCYPLPQWMRPRRCSHVSGEEPESDEPDLRVWCRAEADYRSVAKADAATVGATDAISYWCAAHAPAVTAVPLKLAAVGKTTPKAARA
jgi:hypothetical protein